MKTYIQDIFRDMREDKIFSIDEKTKSLAECKTNKSKSNYSVA